MRIGRQYTEEETEEFIYMYTHGVPVKEISERFNMDRIAIQNRVAYLQISRVDRVERKNPKDFLEGGVIYCGNCSRWKDPKRRSDWLKIGECTKYNKFTERCHKCG